MHNMFNIFREEGEQADNSIQMRELLRRAQHPKLQDTVNDLEVRSDLGGIIY